MTQMTGTRSPRVWTTRAVVLTGILGLLIGAYSAWSQLRLYDWDPAGMIGVGVADDIRLDYAERVFGREIPLRGALGHDGRFFIIQAMDPFFLDVEDNAAFLDRPTYRSQRMLYPTLASVAGSFAGPEGVAWAMAGLNVLAFGVGAAATAVVAVRFGVSALWGLAFPLNPGVLFELHIDGGGVVAFAAAMVGVALLQRSDTWPAVIALTAAVLSREVMLVAVLGVALAKGVGSVRRRATIALVPLIAAALWRMYIEVRVGDLPSGQTVQEIGLPLKGILGAADRWLQDADLSLIIGVFYVFASIVIGLRALRRWSVLELPAAGFGALGLLLTEQVWTKYFDISRALVAVPTFLALSLAVSLFGGRRESAVGLNSDVADPPRASSNDR